MSIGGVLQAIPLQAAVMKFGFAVDVRSDKESGHGIEQGLRTKLDFLHIHRLLFLNDPLAVLMQAIMPLCHPEITQAGETQGTFKASLGSYPHLMLNTDIQKGFLLDTPRACMLGRTGLPAAGMVGR